MKLDLSRLVEQYGSDFINLSLLEIGCRPSGKISQLNSKKQLLLDNVDDSVSINIYRGLAHYYPLKKVNVDDEHNPVDYMILCNYFTNEMFEFENRDKSNLRKFAKADRCKQFLEQMLKKRPKDFHKFIRDCHNEKYNALRGRIAEIMIYNYIMRNKPENLKFYRNPVTDATNERFYHGTEIDGVFVFQEKNYFIEFLEKLDDKKNLEVKINGKFKV